MLVTTKSLSNTLWPFFLWGYIKDKVFVPPVPVTLDDLKQRITTATAGVEDLLTRVWQEFDYRVDIGCVTKGAHIEHLLSCCNKLPEFLCKIVHSECRYLK
jgi:hypothetical protein